MSTARVSPFVGDPEYERGRYGPSSLLPDYEQGYEDGFRSGLLSMARRMERTLVVVMPLSVLIAIIAGVWVGAHLP